MIRFILALASASISYIVINLITDGKITNGMILIVLYYMVALKVFDDN